MHKPGVCLGPRCSDYGGKELLQALRQRGILACAIGCQSLCTYSPVVHASNRHLLRASLEDIECELNAIIGSDLRSSSD